MDNDTTENTNWLAEMEMKSFLQEAWQASGFKEPTLIQERAVPLILEGKDIIAESPTGTGKTMAYLLPLLHRIDTEKKNAQAIILTPSHELAMQIFQTVQQWTKGSAIRSASIIGGTNINRQVDNLKKHPHIIVGTTGRLLELIKMKKLKMHEVKSLVVDEFDVLIAQEHVDNLKSIIKTTLRDRQILFFSATLSDKTQEIGKALMKEPQTIQIKKEEYAPSKTEHLYILCEQREKIDVLRKIVRYGDVKALAFVNDGNKIPEIAERLKYKSLDVDVLTSESTKNERKEALKRFRIGKFPLLIATDVAARGLDIEGLTHVIQWDVPRYGKQYTHRSGRVGRMGAIGTVVSIITKREESFLKKIAKELNITVKKKKLYMGKLVDTK